MDLNYIAVENLPAGYLVLDVRDHCRIVKTNARVRACLGLNDETLEGRTIEDLKDYFDVDADWCRELMAQALAQDRGAEVTRYCPRQKKWFRILAGASEGRLLSLYLSDVTEERASVAWMRTLVEGAQDIVFFLSEDLVVENVITEKEADLFVPRDRLVGRSLEEVLEGGNLAALREGVAYAGTHEDKFRYEYASADRSRWFLAEIFAMATREKRGFVLSIRDITRQKKLEMALLARNEQYALAIQGSNDGIWDWNLKTDDLYLSPHWKRQLGYEDHELTNSFKTFYSLIVLEDRERVSRRVADYLEGRIQSYKLEFRMAHKSGEVRWILARGEALRDEKGVPYRMAGSHTDITDQRRTVEALEASEERLRQMAESIDDVFWLTDARTGRMLYVNPAYEKIWGQPVDRLYKREQSFIEAIVDEDLPGVTDHYRRYLEGEDFDMTYRVRTPGGEVRHIHAKSRPVHDEAGKVIRHVGIARDVTPLHRVEAEKAAIFDEYEQVFNGTQDSMFLVERTGEGELRYIRNNRAHQQSTGLSLEMIRGKTPRELAGEELGSRIEGNYRRCLEEKRPLRYEENLDLGGTEEDLAHHPDPYSG